MRLRRVVYFEFTLTFCMFFLGKPSGYSSHDPDLTHGILSGTLIVDNVFPIPNCFVKYGVSCKSILIYPLSND